MPRVLKIEEITDGLCDLLIEHDDGSVWTYAKAQRKRFGDQAVERPLLTKREEEILRFLVRGLSNASIAKRLGRSEHTVKFHVVNIMLKLQATCRTDAVVIAIRRGLVHV